MYLPLFLPLFLAAQYVFCNKKAFKAYLSFMCVQTVSTLGKHDAVAQCNQRAPQRAAFVRQPADSVCVCVDICVCMCVSLCARELVNKTVAVYC